MKVSNGVLRVISCLLVICMVITGIQFPVLAADGGVTTTNFALKIGDTVITDSTTELPEVSEGDKISIEFNWSLDNSDRTRREFSIDFNSLIQNLEIIDVLTTQKLTKDSEEVGEYTIEDGVLYIKFYDGTDFINGDERYGGLKVDGTIALDAGTDPNASEIELQIGTLKKTLPYVNKANLCLWKDTVDAIQVVDDGNGGKVLQQKFKLDIHTQNGTILLNSVDDIMGSGLSNMSDVTVTSNNVASMTGLVAGNTYTWAEFQSAVANKYIEENEAIIIEYTANVDESIYASDAVADNYRNKAQAYYNDLVEPIIDDATPSVHKTYVNKTGSIVEKEGVTGVNWTITVYLNDFDDVEWDTVVSQIQDTLGDGLVGSGNVVTLDKSQFVLQSDGSYTYEYFTAITDEYLNSTTQKTVSNSVTVNLDHPDFGQFTYTDTGAVTTAGKGWVYKDFVSYNPDTKIATWKIKLENIPAGVTDVKLTDTTSEWNHGSHVVTDTTISVEYNAGSGAKTNTVVENGSLVEANNYYDTDKVILSEYVYNSWSTDYCEIKFDDDFISSVAGTDVYVNITTKITDTDMSKTFKNKATLTYTEGSKTQSYNAEDSFKDPSNSVDKTGTAVAGKNAIDYKVYVDLTRFEIESGKVLKIEDTLPAGLVLDTTTGDNGISSLFGNKDEGWSIWIADLSNIMDVNVTDKTTGDVITAQITVDDNLYNMWLEKNNGSNNLVIELKYRAYVEDQSAFTRAGETVTFVNNVTGIYDGTNIGSDSSTVDLTPAGVVNKVLDTTNIYKTIVEYQVDINENKLDLSDGKVIGKDVLGRGLAYIFNNSTYPITVEAETTEGIWTTLTLGTDYTFEYSSAENALTFTLPDETHLRITYSVYVNIRKEEYYQEDIATNQFTLSGIKDTNGGGNSILPKASLAPIAWADYTTGDITLYKYWNNGEMIALPGAEFALYKMIINGNTLEQGELVEENISVSDVGTVVVQNLNVDTVYCLIETKAAIGYEKNDKPYYFVLPGANMVTLPDGYDIQYFVDNSTLYYENEPTTTGTLVLTKTISGITDWSQVADKIEFVIQSGTDEVMTVKGTELDETTHSKSILLNTGTYTVTEKVTDITGYACEITYTVGTSAAVENTVASNVVISENAQTSLTFDNAYSPIKGQITVKKTVTGDREWEDVKDNVTFEILSGTTVISTIVGSIIDTGTMSKTVEVEPGTYTVRETVTTLDGYTCTTTYKVNAGSETSGTETLVEVFGDAEVVVEFTNDYTAIEPPKGKLTVGKTVSGSLSWDDVKNNISFEISQSGNTVTTISGAELDATTLTKTVELEPGTYKVLEIITVNDGYTCETIYTVDSQSATSGKVAEVTVVSDGEVSVAFTNAYAEKPTEEPTTEAPTEEPTTEEPTTEEPTTEEPTTEEPTTEEPTTEEPTTEETTTEEPTTEEPTTEEPTTEEPTTEEPTTEEPTTEAPTTEPATTEAPTTEAPTTEPATTEAPTTEPATTEAPTTEAPTEPEAPGDSEEPTEPETPVGGDSPKTGDSGVGVYMISVLISLMVIIMVYSSRKKEIE